MLFAALFACVPGSRAQSLAPDQLFERVAPGVWAVRALDAAEKPLATGSGVAVAPGKVVTSCQVLARARGIQLRRGNMIFEAKLEFPDVERDLCQLDVPGLTAPASAKGVARALRAGQRIYVVGYTRGFEQSISDGLVSALRDAETGPPKLLTSVPAARGLLGAGVFDGDGRLVGVVTASPKDAPNAVLAVPVEWLDEIGDRGRAALQRARQAPALAGSANAPASPALPSAGATYRYQWAERKFGRQQEFKVQVNGVDGWSVNESVMVAGAPGTSAVVNARERLFIGRRLAEGQSLLEFAPYLTVQNPAELFSLEGQANYSVGGQDPWTISVRPLEWDAVTVPAGNFRALRLEIHGSRRTGNHPHMRVGVPERFEFTVWYSPEAKRYVKLAHKVWSFSGLLGDELVELQEYRAN